MKDHWKIFDGPIEEKDSWKDYAIILVASLIVAGIIHDLINILT
jgi:hypothetical protein